MRNVIYNQFVELCNENSDPEIIRQLIKERSSDPSLRYHEELFHIRGFGSYWRVAKTGWRLLSNKEGVFIYNVYEKKYLLLPFPDDQNFDCFYKIIFIMKCLRLNMINKLITILSKHNLLPENYAILEHRLLSIKETKLQILSVL